jgi:rfaE bifunctional protein nucleotidyltransferase chain/domain
MNEKIITLEELAARSAVLRAAGKRIVTTNGCFDLLHVGHVRYLRAARALGDVLAVGLNGDDSVRELKGPGRPVNTERDRAEILAALECVNFVTVFSEPRATRFLSAAHPAIYAKGGDYTSENLNTEERAILETIGAEIRIIPFEVGYSTSALLQRLCEIEEVKARVSERR